jgi:hypothetical protein
MPRLNASTPGLVMTRLRVEKGAQADSPRPLGGTSGFDAGRLRSLSEALACLPGHDGVARGDRLRGGSPRPTSWRSGLSSCPSSTRTEKPTECRVLWT